jgi:hypothetical protein
MVFQPGVSANPNGRKPGTRNRRTEAIWGKLEARGDIDPAEHLSSLVSDKTKPDELRAQAANFLMPYKYSKRGTLPAPRFVDESIPIPDFASIQDAQNFLADISRRAGAGELELQSALDISTLVKNWILSVNSRQEFDLKVAAQGGGSDQTIRIEGGMPALPGTNIIMDETARGMNGHNGHPAIDHEPAVNDSLNGTNVTPSLPQSD